MFVSLRSFAFAQADTDSLRRVADSLREAGGRLPGAGNSWAGLSDAGLTLNAGQVAWRTEFASERAALEAPLGALWSAEIAPLLEGSIQTAVGYHVTQRGLRGTGAGIWRALVFRVWPHGYPDLVKQLEAGLLSMPGQVSTIRSWALSSVMSCEGVKAFTHVWEQEFDAIEGLTGEYMDHPVHWGIVDGFFDAEMPQYIVDPYLLQIVSPIDHPIIA